MYLVRLLYILYLYFNVGLCINVTNLLSVFRTSNQRVTMSNNHTFCIFYGTTGITIYYKRYKIYIIWLLVVTRCGINGTCLKHMVIRMVTRVSFFILFY